MERTREVIKLCLEAEDQKATSLELVGIRRVSV